VKNPIWKLHSFYDMEVDLIAPISSHSYRDYNKTHISIKYYIV
jgi:hypothetical protein